MARRKPLLDALFPTPSLDEQLDLVWSRLSRCKVSPEWENFDTFKTWAVENGFQDGSSLAKRVRNKPWGPSNCRIVAPEVIEDLESLFSDSEDDTESVAGKFTQTQEREFCRLWNKTVNRIRKHFGLPLFKEEPDNE